MHSNPWAVWDCYSDVELQELPARLESRAHAAFRAGDYDLGHEYYLLLCQAVMAQTLRQVGGGHQSVSK